MFHHEGESLAPSSFHLDIPEGIAHPVGGVGESPFSDSPEGVLELEQSIDPEVEGHVHQDLLADIRKVPPPREPEVELSDLLHDIVGEEIP